MLLHHRIPSGLGGFVEISKPFPGVSHLTPADLFYLDLLLCHSGVMASELRGMIGFATHVLTLHGVPRGSLIITRSEILINTLQYLGWAERFFKKDRILHVIHPFAPTRRYATANHDGQKTTFLLEIMSPLAEDLAIHARHPDVCNHDVRLVFTEEFEATFAVIGRNDDESSVLQFQFKETPNVGFVVDDQDFFLTFQGGLLPRLKTIPHGW
jgi:hypothetical protein